MLVRQKMSSHQEMAVFHLLIVLALCITSTTEKCYFNRFSRGFRFENIFVMVRAGRKHASKIFV